MSKTITNVSIGICCMVFTTCMALSCSEQNSNETFIVPLDTMPVYNRTDSKMPPPPPPKRAYYFPSNFIIDTSGQVFFYQRQGKWNDDVQTDWNTPPEFIDLKPKDIVEIPNNGIEEFIKLNILNIYSSKRYIAIASAKDTMTSIGLSKIIAICKDENNHIRWKFRLMTQEETIVLNYKKGNRNYDSEEIKWDSTKIKMPAKVKTN